jgi:outer membrane protein
VPLYSSGAVSAAVREADAQRRVAEHDYESALRRVHRDTQDAFLRVHGLSARITAAGNAVRSTEKSMQAMERGFSLGAQTTIDVLDARQNAFRARREHSDARYQYLLQWTRLRILAGDFSESEVQILSSLLNQASHSIH